MSDQLELTFRRVARESIPREATVLVAVSGGGDSVALLHLLLRYAGRRGPDLQVAHLDHALRAGSVTDRRFVARLAGELGLPCHSDRRAVGQLSRRGESPEESARRIRREFLIEVAKESGAQLIATGHTLDDQAETILMRLCRGAGATALTGIAERGPGPFVRPLLGISRQRLRDYLSRRRLAFRDDPSNANLRFDRNRVRRLILPLLTEQLNAQAARHLVKAAATLRADALYLDAVATRALRRITRRDRKGRLTLDPAALSRLADPVGRRVARLAIEQAGSDPRHILARHVEALLDLAAGASSRECHLPGHLVARRTRATIVIGGERAGGSESNESER